MFTDYLRLEPLLRSRNHLSTLGVPLRGAPSLGRRTIVLAGMAAAGAGVLGGCTSERAARTPKFNSVDITGGDFAANFALPDASGRERTLGEFRGRTVALFFGFTQCPDVCPTTLTEMAEVKKLLGRQGDLLQVVFVTVDPSRDTPEVLRAYMGNFDPTFVALIPSEKQLEAVAKGFRIHYRKEPGATPTSYTMEHTAATFLFDPQGRLRLFSRYGMKPEQLAADVRELLADA